MDQAQRYGNEKLYFSSWSFWKHSTSLRNNNIATGCNGDQDPALVHAQISFNKRFHWHLVIHITLSEEHKNTPVKLNLEKVSYNSQESKDRLFHYSTGYNASLGKFMSWETGL